METFLDTEFLNLLDGKRLLVIGHLFGLAVGAGAAFASDFLFVHTLKDRRISTEQLAVLKLISNVVWLGLSLLIVTGGLMFLGDSERLADSSKFLAKMTVVLILTINGLLFRFRHVPLLEGIVGQDITKLQGVSLRGMFISGGLSGVSWAAALILGALRSVDYSYGQIMAVYGLMAAGAMLAGLGLQRYYQR